jgi:putative MATE family efflux protein
MIMKEANKIENVNKMKKRNGVTDMTSGSPLKLISMFALPLLAGNILQQAYSITDTIIVGNFAENGDDAIAAIGMAGSVRFLMMALFFGIGQGASIIISQFYGANDKEGIKRAVDTIYVFLFVSAVPLTVTGLIVCRPLLAAISAEGRILEYAAAYLGITFLGILPSFGYNLNGGILNGLGNSKISLLFLGIATVLNIALDFLFLLVFKMGVSGVAIATVIAQSTAFIFGIIYINKNDYGFKISLNPRNLKVDFKLLKNIARIGLPGGIQNMLFSVGFMFMFNLINTINSDYPGFTTGFTSAQRIDAFAFLPLMSFAAAVTTFVGQNIGAGNLERVKKGVRMTCGLAMLSSVLICAAVLPFSSNLLGMFSQTPEVIGFGQGYLFRMMPFIWILAIHFIISNALRGAGQAMIPLFGSIIGLWLVRIPSAYFLAWLMPETPVNIYFSFVIGWTLGLIPILGYYISGKWKEKAFRFVKKN